MARIRAIKPEFWSSPGHEQLAGDPWARLLFIAMWNWADDEGRGVATPRELAGFAFPRDEDISSADIRRMLGGIRRAFGVEFYSVGGREYYAIPSWEKHQKIDRRSSGKYPGPEEGQPWNPDPTSPDNTPADLRKRPDSADLAGDSAESAESPASARRTPGAGTGEQGNRGTGEEKKTSSSSSRSRATRIPEDFTVTPEMVAWAGEKAPDVNGARETEKFINYWRAKSGKDATKVDWERTWQNWFLTAQERIEERRPGNVVALRSDRTGTDDGPGSAAHWQRAMERAKAREAGL